MSRLDRRALALCVYVNSKQNTHLFGIHKPHKTLVHVERARVAREGSEQAGAQAREEPAHTRGGMNRADRAYECWRGSRVRTRHHAARGAQCQLPVVEMPEMSCETGHTF